MAPQVDHTYKTHGRTRYRIIRKSHIARLIFVISILVGVSKTKVVAYFMVNPTSKNMEPRRRVRKASSRSVGIITSETNLQRDAVAEFIIKCELLLK